MTGTDFLAASAAAVCACMDLRRTKVSNRFLAFVFITGAVMKILAAAGVPGLTGASAPGLSDGLSGASASSLSYGFVRSLTPSLTDSLPGGVIPFLVLFPFFVFRMIGAGDIKLLMVMGFLLGRERGILCLVWSFVIGAVISLAIMLAGGTAEKRMVYLFTYIRQILSGGKRVPYRKGWEDGASVHFTVPVLMAVILITGGVIQ